MGKKSIEKEIFNKYKQPACIEVRYEIRLKYRNELPV